MAIVLYEHNQTAYEQAIRMLHREGKAAIIHPTGTGKSLIGFKLCEEHPDKIICWLSPSRYIFSTQLENLAAVSEGYQPQNIRFFTYARLMHMTDEELLQIQPDFIVMDEFHRCGAQAWGIGVKRLLEQYETVPFLGLSATAVRYLDNQRDMSDEIFDGHVAGEMSLGEAIVRGILQPPKYVLSIFNYQKDLETYGQKIQRLGSKKRKEQAEDILEQLRRTLEQAEGLDEIFDRHMAERTGKYIVFCANYEAMQEAMHKVGEWFGRIDKEPHTYSVYADDPTASQAFDDFRKDDSAHLRLLFCIDALNEGVHVEDISGVILLRPTVSPIVYKQQIGRALSASKKTNPIIFDVVNNIENLYSIDTVREEMNEAIQYMKGNKEEEGIVHKSFQVLDAIGNCLELFNQLEGVLTASWDVMFQEAKTYFEQHGHLRPTLSYVTDNGYGLGRWLGTQRINRSKGFPGLTKEKIDALDSIGMEWDSLFLRKWMRYYGLAKRYHEQHGHLDIPTTYETEGGIKLGIWISSQRENYAKGKLSEEQIQRLNTLGMSWDRFASKWEQGYRYCIQYIEEHGDINSVPDNFVYNDFKLSSWLRVQRNRKRSGKLTEERIEKLSSIGFYWDVYEAFWKAGYAHACAYLKEHGNLKMPTGYVCEDGFKLKSWLNNQAVRKKKGLLTEAQIEKLQEIGK